LYNFYVFVTLCFRQLIRQAIITFAHPGHRGHDHMIVGFTTTCAISAYLH